MLNKFLQITQNSDFNAAQIDGYLQGENSHTSIFF